MQGDHVVYRLPDVDLFPPQRPGRTSIALTQDLVLSTAARLSNLWKTCCYFWLGWHPLLVVFTQCPCTCFIHRRHAAMFSSDSGCRPAGSWFVLAYVQHITTASRSVSCAHWSSLFLDLRSVDVCKDLQGPKFSAFTVAAGFFFQPAKHDVALSWGRRFQTNYLLTCFRLLALEEFQPQPDGRWRLGWRPDPSMWTLNQSDVTVAAPPLM